MREEGSLEGYSYRVREGQLEDSERGVEVVGIPCARETWIALLVDRMEPRLPRLICLQSHCPSSEKVFLEEDVVIRHLPYEQ